MNLAVLALSAPLLSSAGEVAPSNDRTASPDEDRSASIENRLAALERQLAAAELSQVESDQDDADSLKVTLDSKGLRIRSADGEASMKIGGRVQVDGNIHTRDATHNGSEINDGTELRRARFEMKGRLPGDVIWAAEVDFADNGTSIKDFWMGFDKDEVTTTIGHQKQPFSLGVEMSSNDIPFVERGVDNFLIIPFVDRAVGVRLQGNTDNLFFAGGVFGESVTPGANNVDDEGWGVVSRVVAAPVQEDDQVLHFAGRGAYRMPMDGTMSVQIRDETTNMSNYRVVDTGVITGVDSTAIWGGEATWAAGPFSLGGEFNSLHLMRDGSDYNLSSWHAQATYTLTGESRADAYRMDAGEFKRLRASDDSDCGAWELASRFATIDLNDGTSLRGGREDVATVAVNWYYNDNVRFMLDWSRILAASGAGVNTNPNRADGTDVFTLRAQLTF